MKINPSDGKVKRTYHLEAYQVETLKMLSKKTRIKQVDFIREAINDLILKYKEDLPKDLIRDIKEKFYRRQL